MKQYLFVLGRTPKLALVELQNLVTSPILIRPDIALGHTDMDPVSLMQVLGGTVKVCEVVYTGLMPTVEDLDAILTIEVKENKLVFGISTYGEMEAFTSKALFSLKEVFVERGVHTRFIESKHDAPLSSVVISKQKITELVIVEGKDDWYVGITRSVQDFEQWNERDYARPFQDAKHGMLPPKVARMIVNIAKEVVSTSYKDVHDPILLDPFCGAGTVLVEALTVGWRVIGADISEHAIERTRKNLSWARAHYGLQNAVISLHQHDATHISDVVKDPVHAIVTEPYMGNTNASSFGNVIERGKAKNIIKGLEKLYIGCLREWAKILAKGGVIVMALPQYTIGKDILFVKKLLTGVKSSGILMWLDL